LFRQACSIDSGRNFRDTVYTNMKRIWYAILLEGLKILVRIKRGVVFLIQIVKKIFVWLDALVRNTIGFRLYIWQKKFEKYIQWYTRVQPGRVLEFFGQRYMLQTILILIGVIVGFPHSQLFTQDSTVIPGRSTRLYAFSGPGDQDFDIEVVVVDSGILFREESGRFWSDGAVVRPTTQTTGSGSRPAVLQSTGLALGGRALIKPTIAPGSNNTGTNSDSTTTNIINRRSQPFTYEVEPGDVLGGIATKFGISIETILWANNLTARSVIRPGDTLTILPTSGVLHTVKSGDTLGLIARLYRADITDIVDQNNISSGGTIQIGQQLIIPGGTRIAVATPVARPTTPTTPSPSRPATPTTPAPPSTANPSQSGYIWPTNVRTITQYYGWRHTGVDIAGPVGSPLYASKAGTVVTSQCGWNGGYGCYIIIDHGDGFQTLYAHASELYVSVGESVTQGQTIAAMGSTGRSTGPHIHFEIRVGGRHVNPFSYVN